jgi:pectinesterase
MTKIVVLLLFSFMTGLLAFMPRAIIANEAKSVRPDWVPDWVVAADGSGDFQTLQEAIDAVPINNQKRVVILIKPGVYKAHVVIPKNKPFITLSGQDAEKTVLTNDLHQESIGADGRKAGATGSATVVIYGADFRAQNITFENNAPRVAQALAIYVDADRALFRHCRFLGYQDTVRVRSGRQFFDQCFINGRTDFIYGEATAWFERCHIHALDWGWITAARTPKEQPFGLVFSHCKITAEPGIKTMLGRPWGEYAGTVWLHTQIHDAISPTGWHNWDKPEAEKTVRYAEYASVTPDGKAIDLSTRVPWAKRLIPEEATRYTMSNVLGDWKVQEAD